ncbi:hypothetical protein [Stenotrophomonas pavanii]|uniref:hypothetical protein n=1 Tax=Stenotrophomonas pavanii TaxID=487698 RepID=UPI001131D837|nr:hypothetical protein [Stenotrophomonas pavanii]
MSSFTDALGVISQVLISEPRNEFVSAHTGFDSIDELLFSAGVDPKSDDALHRFIRNDADAFIQQVSPFASWQEFLHASAADVIENQG